MGLKKLLWGFMKPLGSSSMVFSKQHANRLKLLIPPIVSMESVVLLNKEVTVEEIKATLFNMKPNKAPGPDGFTADFFKASWSVVGDDFVAAVKSFFDTSFLLK